ncbi:O-antigen ligase family protein [Xylophilus sp. ASV27]|uniref:O-antigen ligase family protein n=1 Tax=Xylophilus sp. ASV27 TaxID=2795129 RepID=UPI001E4553A5|nr:O-antigen ligase family protein [Xylophilus sp. ASV27]
MRLTSAAAFLVPGLALWRPSGYSYGVALLLLGALLFARRWPRRLRPLGGAGWMALSIVLMGVVWLLDARSGRTDWGGFDRPSKYLLALPCLFLVHAYAPRARCLWWGVVVGAVGSGLMALYQRYLLHMPRSEGFTNAIQYGGLSLLLGLMCLVLVAVRPPVMRRPWAVGLAGCGAVLGPLGSVLSESRGGWLALLVVLPVMGWLCWQRLPRRRFAQAALMVALGLLGLFLTQPHLIDQRLDAARAEIAQYEAGNDGVTSVGQRLHHWKLAWQMGWDRPLTGWTQHGYELEKARRVQAGLAHPSVLAFSHAHNEALDLFAKRGLPGVAVLLFFYGVPLWLFWPTRRRLPPAALEHDGYATALALRLVGVLVPVAYIGFGLTQVFMAHNSGNICYLFFNMLVYGCLRGQEALVGAGPTGAQRHARPAGQ